MIAVAGIDTPTAVDGIDDSFMADVFVQDSLHNLHRLHRLGQRLVFYSQPITPKVF